MPNRPEEANSEPEEANSELRFESSFPPSLATLSGPRETFSRWLTDDGTDASTVEELTIVYSELVSNAATHRGTSDGPIRTEAWRDGADVVLTVENPGADEGGGVRHWDLADALRGGGRGLMLVRAFTDSIEALRSRRGALMIRCRRHLSGS